MATAAPVKYDPSLETVRANEDETVAGLNETFDTILTKTAEDYGHAVRAVHAKGHAILEGTFEVEPNLPPELAQGLFSTPGRHRVVLRISSNAGDILTDKISLPRGLAMKVFDAAGERLPGAEGTAQDFVMVNGPVFQARTADKFLGSLKPLAKTTDVAEGAKVALSAVLRGVTGALSAIGIESPTLQSLGGAPNVEPLGETYFSVTPFRYGDYVAKFSLAPRSASLSELTGRTISVGDDPDAIRHAVQSEMAGIDAEWDFRVQLCRDVDRQPIEDPTKPWSEEEAPFQTVATVRVGRQDSWAPEKVRDVDEEMRFSVWTGLAAHRPLGDINRARRETYLHSAGFRQRFNGCPIHEPGA